MNDIERDATQATQAEQATEAPPPGVKHERAIFALDGARPLDRAAFPNPPESKGAPAATIPNVEHLLAQYGIDVQYDVIKKKVVVRLPGHDQPTDNLDNAVITQVTSLAILNGMSTGQVPAIVAALADRNPYNPVKVWIESRPWDGKDRLPEFYATLEEREGFPSELKEALMRRWLLSAVAAALKPAGFNGRGVLTLQGAQGIGKTKWTRALVPDPALSRDLIKLDHHLDPGDKDSLLAAISRWIVEIGELDSSFRKDVARLKGFLTSDQDIVRSPYARAAGQYPRRTVFCATVNEENFLVDPTGNNRFWTIPVARVDYGHRIDMQQLFAQLAGDFARGAEWWLSADEERQLNEHNRAHVSVSYIRERILDAVDPEREWSKSVKAMSASEVLREIGFERPTNPQCRECGGVLRELFGDPKLVHKVAKWRVPFKRPEGARPAMQGDDDQGF